MNKSHPLKTLNTLIFYGSCVLLIVSCWHRNDFPSTISFAALEAPVQTPVEESPFSVSQNDNAYQIEPRYDYDLTGLVVSYAHHDGNYSLHRLWNDHLNVADVCVVWDHNARKVNLNAFDFWNGEFTCNFQTRDSVAWKSFREDQISNNHLLADDSYVRKQIGKMRIGDRIRVRGWLADYRGDNGFSRGTSTTRDDKGNGACETIYVRDFRILTSMNNGWRMLLNLSLLGTIATAVIWVVAVVRGVF